MILLFKHQHVQLVHRTFTLFHTCFVIPHFCWSLSGCPKLHIPLKGRVCLRCALCSCEKSLIAPLNDCFDIIDLFFCSNNIILRPSDTQSQKLTRRNALNILPQTATGFPQILTLNLIMMGIQSRNHTSTNTHRGRVRRL